MKGHIQTLLFADVRMSILTSSHHHYLSVPRRVRSAPGLHGMLLRGRRQTESPLPVKDPLSRGHPTVEPLVRKWTKTGYFLEGRQEELYGEKYHRTRL